MLEDLKQAANKTVGTKQTMKAVQAGKVREVFLASDVDEYIARKIRDLCEKHGVPVIVVDTMAQLGEACSIEIGAATAALLK